MKEKVIIGMSGGVDSSVAAYLLKEQGYDVVGVTMQTLPEKDSEEGGFGKGAIEDAKKVAELLEIPYYVLDFTKEFKENVIEYFVGEYIKGRTPNPCIICNRCVKWEALLSRGEEFGAEYIATGHYARKIMLPNGRYSLKVAKSQGKDQTYALYNLTQEQLQKTIMPAGEYTKDEIREIAKKIGLEVADKPDSQDICFVTDNDYAGFVKKNSGITIPTGNFVDLNGNVLGTHKGIIHYTVGQRKGLNLALGHPVFVLEIRPETNEVVIGESEETFRNELYCTNINLMAVEDITEPVRVMAKIRYSHKGTWCTVKKVGEDRLKCTFEEPVRAVTPGQAVVFYEKDYIFGGGIIE